MNCCNGRVGFAVWVAFVAALDGGRVAAAPPQRLTTDGRLKETPVFVDEGRALVYTVEQKFNQLALMRHDLTAGRSEPLHPGAPTSEFGASFSADGSRYAFVRNDGNLHVSIVQRDVRTQAEASFNPGAGFAGVRSLDMAPDGSRVVFVLPESGFEQSIFALDRTGKQRTAVTAGGGFDAFPRFSPDGRKLVFTSTRTGNFDLHVMTHDGQLIAPVTEHPSLDTHPAWSPDGRRLAFTSLRDGNYEVYVVAVDGTGLRRITDHPERDDFPAWHPDGRRLVVVSERDGRHDLYLVDVER